MRLPAELRHRQASQRGFTLIEILVVVAIIALLISILLPSLFQAKEQSKIVRCLANEGSLGKATGMYLVNNRERFPWGPRYKNGLEVPSGSGTGPTNPLTRTWYFGGNRGQNSASLGTGGFYVTGSEHDWSPRERPLNTYAYSTSKLTNADNRRLGTEGSLTLFRCPSDQGVRWNGDPSSTLKGSITAYLEVGTSYQSNNSWGYYAKNHEYTGQPQQANRMRYLMDRIVSLLLKKGPSRAVLIYEDTADWALNTTFPAGFKVRTWHNKFDIHNLMFADGHAAATFVDYTKNYYTDDYAHQHAGDHNWVVRQYYKEEAN